MMTWLDEVFGEVSDFDSDDDEMTGLLVKRKKAVERY